MWPVDRDITPIWVKSRITARFLRFEREQVEPRNNSVMLRVRAGKGAATLDRCCHDQRIHKDIDVAGSTKVISQDGVEEGQFANVMFSTTVSNLGLIDRDTGHFNVLR